MIEWATGIDLQFFHYINQDLANPVLDVVMPVLRNRLTWIPVYILLAIYTVRKHGSAGWNYIVFILLVFACSDLITYQILKPLFHRNRPCYDEAIQARLVLGHCGGKWGFPSSHATNHMAISIGIILCGIFRSRIMNGIIIFWAIAIGFAQIYIGVHYPLDILAGFVWGAFLAVGLFYVFKPGMEKNKGG